MHQFEIKHPFLRTVRPAHQVLTCFSVCHKWNWKLLQRLTKRIWIRDRKCDTPATHRHAQAHTQLWGDVHDRNHRLRCTTFQRCRGKNTNVFVLKCTHTDRHTCTVMIPRVLRPRPQWEEVGAQQVYTISPNTKWLFSKLSNHWAPSQSLS